MERVGFIYWLVVDLAWRFALGGKRRLRYLLEASEVEENVDDIVALEDILGEIILYKPHLENIFVYFVMSALYNNNNIIFDVTCQVGLGRPLELV